MSDPSQAFAREVLKNLHRIHGHPFHLHGETFWREEHWAQRPEHGGAPTNSTPAAISRGAPSLLMSEQGCSINEGLRDTQGSGSDEAVSRPVTRHKFKVTGTVLRVREKWRLIARLLGLPEHGVQVEKGPGGCGRRWTPEEEKRWRNHRIMANPEVYRLTGAASAPIKADCLALFEKRERKDIQIFRSPADIQAAVDEVLTRPALIHQATKDEWWAVVRHSDGLIKLVAIDLTSPTRQYQVRSVHLIDPGQLEYQRRPERDVLKALEATDGPAVNLGVLGCRG